MFGEGGCGCGRFSGAMSGCVWRAVLAALLSVVPLTVAPPVAAPPVPCRTAALCLCHRDHLVCNDVPFHQFPETERGVQHISVSGARLGTLGEVALAGRALRTLVLAGNRLHHVEPRALRSMASTLASLDLGYNEFSEAPIEALHDLKALNWLNLQNNHIGELAPDMDWAGLGDSLSSLSLSNNELCVLRSGALAGLRRLTRLELEGNRLRTLEPGALPAGLAVLRLASNLLSAPPCQPLPRLRHLQLRDNTLRPSASTCAQHRLDTMDLSYNQLTDTDAPEVLRDISARHLVLDLNDLTAIPPAVYENFHVEKLSMSHNRLHDISEVALHRLKHNLEQLELNYNELQTLPKALGELMRLRYLSIAYNSLTELHSLPPRLHSLNAAGNFISSLSSGLSALEPGVLRWLDLGYNRITKIEPAQFGAWASKLESLNLRGNRLAALTAGALPTLSLRELLLGFNDLYHVNSGALKLLAPGLRVLELSSAQFNGDFPTGAALEGISWLSLDNNNIHFITSDDFHNLTSLEFVNLDFNKIVEFPIKYVPSDFSYKLKELKLAYNYVSKIVPEFISEMQDLQSIDFSYNRLRNISERTFSNLPALAHLNLVGNDLRQVSEGALHNLANLEVLELQENKMFEFSTIIFDNVANEEAGLSVNLSHNCISLLVGVGSVPISVIDLSYNLLIETTWKFFKSISSHVRRINLSHNQLSILEHTSFGSLPLLEALNLQYNNISLLKRRTFSDLPVLWQLDLGNNAISTIVPGQFIGAYKLRWLRLAGNQIRSLPRDALSGAPLEHLDLCDNRLNVFPASALGTAGQELRQLDLSGNLLEHLDAAMFRELSALRELDLARNALTVLSDNTFASLSRLRRLNLSHNTIKTNFKELFHNLPELRWLALAGAGLRAVPRLLLANLTELDLTDNRVADFRENDVRRLCALRVLGLARNELAALRPAMWNALPRLVALDLTENPIVLVAAGALDGLPRLLRLRLSKLNQLEALEPRALRSLLSLRSLELDAPAGSTLPASVLTWAPHLESLKLHVVGPVLDQQLIGMRAHKLRSLEVRGEALRRVAADAFTSLGQQRALALRLSGTGVISLPAGLARPLARVPHLALDLSDNRLRSISPSTLYPNLSDWNRFATKLLPGGLVVSGNALRCGCAVSWLGGWLRRWTAEVAGGARGARHVGRGATCWRDGRAGHAGRAVPLLELQLDEAECTASALSSRAPPLPARCWLVWPLLMHWYR